MKKLSTHFTMNILLLLAAFTAVFSGMLMGASFHGASLAEKMTPVLGLNGPEWMRMHRISAALFVIFFIYHGVIHTTIINNIIKKKLFSKNIPTLIMGFFITITILTALASVIIGLTNGDDAIRHSLMAIHTKAAPISAIFMILHILKRIKWFKTTAAKLRA